MTVQKPARWRRRDARRRSSVRRLLLWGAATGLGAGIVAQRVVTDQYHGSGEIEWLVRGALILPGIIFVAWWLIFPGYSLEELEPAVDEPIDASERLERIEATFDEAAVPRARRRAFTAADEQARVEYRGSIRRDEDLATIDHATFGVRRPARDAGDRAEGA